LNPVTDREERFSERSLTSETPRRSASTGTVSRQLGARTRSRLRLRTDSESTGPPHGQPWVLVAHRTASAARWRRAAYTRSRVNSSEGFRPNRVPRSSASAPGLPVRGTRPPLRRCSRADLAHRDRFGGRARGPGAGPSGAVPHAFLATGGCWPAGNTATWCCAGVRTELRIMVSRPWCGGWWEQGAPTTIRMTLKGNEAHGRIEPCHVGNDAVRPRTRRRSKALKPTQPSCFDTNATLATGWKGCRSSGGTPTARRQRPR